MSIMWYDDSRRSSKMEILASMLAVLIPITLSVFMFKDGLTKMFWGITPTGILELAAALSLFAAGTTFLYRLLSEGAASIKVSFALLMIAGCVVSILGLLLLGFLRVRLAAKKDQERIKKARKRKP
jgi:hypothetical protein